MSTKAALFALCACVAWTASARADDSSGPTVSLSLAQAVSLGLAGNLTYRSAQADEEAARARVIQAGAGKVPSADASYTYVHAQNAASFSIPVPGPGGVTFKSFPFSSKDVNSVNATLQYALYTGGAVGAAIGQAASSLAASESQLAATRSTVVRDTTNAYFQLIQARRSSAIAAEAAAVAARNVATANELFRAGSAARADLLKQQLSLANSQVSAITAANAAALANADLANLLDINPGSTIIPTETLSEERQAFSLAELLGRAESRRPEVAASEDAVAIAQQAIESARAGRLPAVALSVQEGSTKPNFVNVPQPQLSETLAATWRLFDGGLTRGKIAEASAQLDKARINVRQIANSVDLEVRQSYLNYVAAGAQVSAARTAQTSADENLRVSRVRFAAGVGTSLELADALLADTTARTQYVGALANLRVTLATLQRAAAL
ncbi:MAG: TolC family protein [Candidatus Eremiobacteraeota bacterium]|nr:TolC family protein [Candidatus Eremiobacteraeota bacterium]MBC5828536.1 TolC family protein [Candidatus Eremiobacteraeota bacterium]